MTDRLITAYQAAPYTCSYGVKQFCRANGLSYATFLSPGYPAETLRNTGDQFANEVIDRIEAEAEGDGQQQ